MGSWASNKAKENKKISQEPGVQKQKDYTKIMANPYYSKSTSVESTQLPASRKGATSASKEKLE